MAENMKSSDLDSNITPSPSNGGIIDSLVSNLEKECLIEGNENKPELDEPGSVFKGTDLPKTSLDNADTELSFDKRSAVDSENLEDETSESNENIPSPEDDLVDELAMKDLEVNLSDEDKHRLQKEAEVCKQLGNELFKAGEFRESALAYTKALRTCPLAFSNDRAIFYSNRAAAKMKLDMNESAIEDCTKALELEERYMKALFRRAQLYETTDKLDEALEDYKKILEIDPLHRDALYASKRLPDQIHERNEKLKTEMLGKLKDLGNMFLRPFGLSTDSFQMTQDPNSGGYSVNFKS